MELRPEDSNRLGRREMERIAVDLQHEIKAYVGVTTFISVLDEGRIERTLVGKAKRLIDLRPK